jgi:Citrate synthase, C-terminal domain
MLQGREAPGAFVRALDTYGNTVADHGLNVSTFTARVIVSTEADVVSAVTGALDLAPPGFVAVDQKGVSHGPLRVSPRAA